jgi:hypothetical protein
VTFVTFISKQIHHLLASHTNLYFFIDFYFKIKINNLLINEFYQFMRKQVKKLV